MTEYKFYFIRTDRYLIHDGTYILLKRKKYSIPKQVMNKTQSLYAFHYRNKNTPSSLSFSTLPQIKHLKKLHEKNL